MKQLLNDSHLRRCIQLAVTLVVGCCIISQIMMQLGGGERDQRLDFSDQISEDIPVDLLVFEDGFPPFISSAGAFMPERIVFDIGLFCGGLMMLILSFEIYHRTKPVERKRKICNVVSLISGIIVGFSMMQLVSHPFNTSIVMHIFWAMGIFWGGQVWMATLAYARGDIDKDVSWRGWPIHRVRWALFAIAVLSFQAMTAFVATGLLVESAIFEWTLTFSAEAMMLTLIPALTPSA